MQHLHTNKIYIHINDEQTICSFNLPNSLSMKMSLETLTIDKKTGRTENTLKYTPVTEGISEEITNKEFRDTIHHNLRVSCFNYEKILKAFRELPASVTKCRLFFTGSFVSEEDMNAWMNVIRSLPHIQFYLLLYSKYLSYEIEDIRPNIPSNLALWGFPYSKDIEIIYKNTGGGNLISASGHVAVTSPDYQLEEDFLYFIPEKNQHIYMMAPINAINIIDTNNWWNVINNNLQKHYLDNGIKL